MGARITMASAWAFCLAVPGLWLMIERPQVLWFARLDSFLVGLLSFAMGNFVFMYGVADRLFPSVLHREVAWALELIMISVMMTMFFWLGMRLVGAQTS